MAEKKKIDPIVNRARVKKSMENIDRVNVYLEKGTLNRIKSLGLSPSKFARRLIEEELERLEKMKNKH